MTLAGIALFCTRPSQTLHVKVTIVLVTLTNYLSEQCGNKSGQRSACCGFL